MEPVPTPSADPADQKATSAPPPSPQPPPPPWVRLIQSAGSQPTDEQLKELVHEQIRSDVAADPVSNSYNIMFLYDALAVARSDADQLYRVSKLSHEKPLLLILDSAGGDIGAAYFIAKICRECSAVRFEVAVPRRAKSAATLICCAAERIHMGSLSELGPIDPQFQGVPALALKNSVEHLAELTKRYPEATDLFASYLAKTLRIESLGYYERVAESAAQYAERLLKARRIAPISDEKIASIAQRLVYAYKDHGFVIEAAEAQEVFGTSVVVTNTPEYSLANKLYQSLNLIERVLRDFHARSFAFTGVADSGCHLFRGPSAQST